MTEHRIAVLAKLLSIEGKFMAELFRIVAKINDDMSPYTESDFKITPLNLIDEYHAIFIEQPEPEESPECYTIALCFKHGNNDVENLRYFTAEKASSSPLIEMLKKELHQDCSAPEMMVCEWTEDQTHKNYGPLSPDERIEERINHLLKTEQ